MDIEIEIKLDRSDYVKHRIESMKSLQVPSLSDATTNLDVPLAEIIFQQCDVALEEDFGLSPLDGTGDELWISPSDLLIGKVALTPPLTSKHIQALTHEGILEIGADIEQKFLNEMRMHEEAYFESRKKQLMEEFEEMFRIEAKNIELRERQACQEQQARMIEEFNCILLEELNNLEERLREEHEEALRKQKFMLDIEWQHKLREAVQETVEKLTTQFLDELERQKLVLTNNFKLEIQKAHLQSGYELNLEKAKCQESLRQLRHNLECKNIANMMYVLCMERRKCCDEKVRIEEYYVIEMQKLNQIISNKESEINKITEDRDKQIREVNLRETCLLEIIRQFQKFINFALRAAPTQAEFLLSIEKMMAFELTDAVLKSNMSRLKQCNEILPWKNYEQYFETPKDDGLDIDDYHNCMKEFPPPPKDNDENLPAFYFNDKLYVREDFRNMISQGIEITRSNELWNKDVEILIQTLKESVTHVTEESEASNLLNVRVESKISMESLSAYQKSNGFSSVQFVEATIAKPKKFSIDSKTMGMAKLLDDKRFSIKPVFNSLNNIKFDQIGTVEKKPTLLATTNSLELIMKKLKKIQENESGQQVQENFSEAYEPEKEKSDGSVTVIKKKCSIDVSSNSKEKGSKQSSRKSSPRPSFRDSLVLESRDSVIMQKSSLMKKSMEFNIIARDSLELHRESVIDVKRKPSKIASAKNSLELIRESRCTDMPIPPTFQKGVPTQKSATSNLLSSLICSKIKCPDKCSQTKGSTGGSGNLSDGFKYMKRDSTDRSIKMSHIEIYNVESEKDKDVSINETPVVYETGSTTYTTDLADIYKKPRKTRKIKKRKVKSTKDKFLDLPSTVKVVGDTKAKEHLENVQEFTENRIHSLIELIKDNPTLMRTFTACTR